jgi:hypothetical protein
MAGVGGGGGGGLGVWLEAAAASSFRGGSGKVKSVLGLEPKVCTFLINHRPDDKSVSRVRGLTKKARLIRADIAKAIANPITDSSSLPLAARSIAHYKLKFYNDNFHLLKTFASTIVQKTKKMFLVQRQIRRPGVY